MACSVRSATIPDNGAADPGEAPAWPRPDLPQASQAGLAGLTRHDTEQRSRRQDAISSARHADRARQVVSEPPGTAFASRLIGLLPSLRRYARAISGDAALADDLVQDSIERALARAATLRQPDRLGAWMRGIVHNLYLDELRRRRVRGVRVDVEDMSDDLALSTHAGGGAPDHAPLDAVARAMQGLSLEHRQILVLAGVEELPYRAIAEELQVPMGTVMSRLARARAALRRALESGDPAHGERTP